jgi:hypothetical protein
VVRIAAFQAVDPGSSPGHRSRFWAKKIKMSNYNNFIEGINSRENNIGGELRRREDNRSNLLERVDAVNNNLKHMDEFYEFIKTSLELCKTRQSLNEEISKTKFEKQEDFLNFIIGRVEALEQREGQNIGFFKNTYENSRTSQQLYSSMAEEVQSTKERLALVEEFIIFAKHKFNAMDDKIKALEDWRASTTMEVDNIKNTIKHVPNDINALKTKASQQEERINNAERRVKDTDIQMDLISNWKTKEVEPRINLLEKIPGITTKIDDVYKTLGKHNQEITDLKEANKKVFDTLVTFGTEIHADIKDLKANKPSEKIEGKERSLKLEKIAEPSSSKKKEEPIEGLPMESKPKSHNQTELITFKVEGRDLNLKRITDLTDDEILEEYERVLSFTTKEGDRIYETTDFNKCNIEKELDRYVKFADEETLDNKRTRKLLKEKEYLYLLEYDDEKFVFKRIINSPQSLKKRNPKVVYVWTGQGYRYIPYMKHLEELKEQEEKLKREAEEKKKAQQQKQQGRGYNNSYKPRGYSNNNRPNNYKPYSGYGPRNNSRDLISKMDVMIEAIHKLSKN